MSDMGYSTINRVAYGGIGYKILNYAKFRSRRGDGFTSGDYMLFSNHQYKRCDVDRCISGLLRNGHLRLLDDGRAFFVDTGVLTRLDLAYKERRMNRYLDDDADDLGLAGDLDVEP